MKLRDLVGTLGEHNAVGFETDEMYESPVTSLVQDSRLVKPGSVFYAIRGEQVDGHLFIEKAVQNGAIAIVCESIPEGIQPPSGIPFLRVRDTRKAWATGNFTWFGSNVDGPDLIGVTGTNGKTTTTFLLHQLLNDLGRKSGLIGTVEYRVGNTVLPSTHTTPDASTIGRLLKDMREVDCKVCVMEISSHALSQQRVYSLNFSGAVFTNLTRDHLDYHADFDAYLRAKKSLFDGLSEDAIAVYNLDSLHSEAMLEDCVARKISFGFDSRADVCVTIVENTINGLALDINGIRGSFRLVGRFNAYNLAAAYATAIGMGHDPEATFTSLQSAGSVRGRFEQIRFENGVSAVIDYAHTPDALKNVLETIREGLQKGDRIWCIAGCGGDRDHGKRPEMGAIAEKLSDVFIATSDNPRTEDPLKILDEIRTGVSHPDRVIWEENRRDAIALAAEKAVSGDLILIAGKGHETYQVIGSNKVHFDDREEIIAAFAKRGIQPESND